MNFFEKDYTPELLCRRVFHIIVEETGSSESRMHELFLKWHRLNDKGKIYIDKEMAEHIQVNDYTILYLVLREAFGRWEIMTSYGIKCIHEPSDDDDRLIRIMCPVFQVLNFCLEKLLHRNIKKYFREESKL